MISSSCQNGYSAKCRTQIEFTQLYQKALPSITLWLGRHVHNHDDREEILGNAGERAWRYYDRLENKREFEPWFMTIVQHTAQNYRRQEERKGMKNKRVDRNRNRNRNRNRRGNSKKDR